VPEVLWVCWIARGELVALTNDTFRMSAMKAAAGFDDLDQVLNDIIKSSRRRPGLIQSALEFQASLTALKKEASSQTQDPEQIRRRQVALLQNLRLVRLNATRSPRMSTRARAGSACLTDRMVAEHIKKRVHEADEESTEDEFPEDVVMTAISELCERLKRSPAAKSMRIRRVGGKSQSGKVVLDDRRTDAIVLVTPRLMKRYKAVWEYHFLNKTTSRGKRRNSRNLKNRVSELREKGLMGLVAADARKGRKQDDVLNRRIAALIRETPGISSREIARELKIRYGTTLSHVSVANRMKARIFFSSNI
jgi:hypothetical protein